MFPFFILKMTLYANWLASIDILAFSLRSSGFWPEIGYSPYIMKLCRLISVFGFVFLAFAAACSFSASAQVLTEDKTAAVVYTYFQISDIPNEDRSALSTVQFQSQIQEIEDGHYNVLSLDEIVPALSQDMSLPFPVVAFTFDGTDPSLFQTAFPLLQNRKLPFTVFVSPGKLDDATRSGVGVTWSDVKTLAKQKGVTIGVMPYSYGRMTAWNDERIRSELNKAKIRYREELGSEPAYFAYPYGIYTARVRGEVEKMGFKAAFGQQSGLVHRGADRLALPRFTMTDDFGDLDRFRLTSHALPLPVSDVEPKESIISENPPVIGFTVSPSIPASDVKKLVCFGSGIGKLKTEILGKNRVEIRFPQAFDDGRSRINCTLPTTAKPEQDVQSWRWLGFLLATAEDEPVKPETPAEQTGIE